MQNFINLLGKNYQTPQRQTFSNGFGNSFSSSRGYSTGKRHRNKIFQQTSPRRALKQKISSPIFPQQEQLSGHIFIQQVFSDDFCGCQNTLTLCSRLNSAYFINQVSLNQIKRQYYQLSKNNIKNPLDQNEIRSLMNIIPKDYPEIYFTHLHNLLKYFQNDQVTKSGFRLLVWIQYHCKIQYITYFFYSDLKNSFSNKVRFQDSLQIALIKQNFNIRHEIYQYEKLSLRIHDFINDYYQSAGASIIPISQYAKFLQIVKIKGQKTLVHLLTLLFTKKRKEFYNILKFWTHNEFNALRNYSRQLNWDVFFQQIQIIQ